MSTSLSLDTTSIMVYTDEGLTSELDTTNCTVTTTGLTDGCEFEISFSVDYLNSLTTETTVYVCYTATVNADAEIGETGNPNETPVSYGNNSDVKSTPSTTTTKVREFGLHKHANKRYGHLANAEFVLSYTEGTSDNAVKKYHWRRR